MKTLRIAAAALLIATGLAVATPASADDNGDRKPALCDYRVCLLVVAMLVDTDGDGVTDIDEKYFGTDVLDRLSMPAAQKVIDTALMRELPSFESHLTELVVLPQMTTDFTALATAVGLMDLPTDSWGTKNAPGLLSQFAHNGLTGITSAIGIELPGSGGHDLPEGSSSSYFTYMQQVKDGDGQTYSFDIPGSVGYGANGAKQGGVTTTDPTTGSSNNGTIAIRGGETTTYADGSTDRTKFNASQADKPLDDGWVRTGSSSTTTSKDKDGYVTSITKTTSAVNTNSTTGESNSSTTVTTTFYARSGEPTSSTTTNTKTETKNGETTTTTTTTSTNTHDKPETTTETCTKDCKDHGMVDPDQVQFGILTPGDYARVIARINSVRTPGPDTGMLTDDPPRIPTKDIYSNYTGDGVVVLSSTPNPQFNIAQPEYNSELAEMAQLGGTVPPNPNADDPTGYWPDKP